MNNPLANDTASPRPLRRAGRAVLWLFYLLLCGELIVRAILALQPTVERLLHPPPEGAVQHEIRPVFSYREAALDPAAFGLWWDNFIDEWHIATPVVGARMPKGSPVPFRFKPNTHLPFFLNEISVNDLGFRDRPFPVDKGNRYRIVAIGESNTMGVLLMPADRPWPKVLEAMIGERLTCPRPVEVINGGIDGYSLEHNLVRMKESVLPLKPDLVISYHGYNGFSDPPATPPPVLGDGPSKLLSQLVYRIRMAAYDFRLGKDRTRNYRALYERLIGMTEAGGAKLALATFNMAVTPDSPQEVIRFYQGGFHHVRDNIETNRWHAGLLRELGKAHPEVMVIDTSANLDGKYDGKYIDLVHYTQWGRNTLAWNLYRGLEPLLISQVGCTPVAGLPTPPREVAEDPWTADDLARLGHWMGAQRPDLAGLSIDKLGPVVAGGLSYLEGPYPQWRIPYRFRWVVQPEANARFHVDSEVAAGATLTWRVASQTPRQKAGIALDGVPLASREWEGAGAFQELSATLPAIRSGAHILTLSAERFVEYPGDDRKLYLMAGPLNVHMAAGEKR